MRASLVVNCQSALVAAALGRCWQASLGLAVGVVTGLNRWVDASVNAHHGWPEVDPGDSDRDSLMALNRASLENVIFAIIVAEVPRVARLVHGVALRVREQPFIEAALACGVTQGHI